MSDARWRGTDNIDEMLELLQGVAVTERKLRLFALECVRTIGDQLRDDRSVRVLVTVP